VAVRVLRYRRDAQYFMNSCRIHAAIQHDRVPPLYEVAEADGRLHSVRQFIDGDHLLNNLRGQPPDIPTVLSAITVAASVVDAIHGLPAVHGSVHPRHLLRDFQGNVWMIGLGELVPPEVLGNPLHLAPEQFARQGQIGPQTDVYQLGETAAWLLTGRHPFDRVVGAESIAAAKQAEDGWLSDSIRQFLSRVQRVLRRALLPDPASRPGTAGEFASALVEGFGTARRAWRQFWRSPR
jgi:serine/threonine protein kinase